jgi:hypothetical protein
MCQHFTEGFSTFTDELIISSRINHFTTIRYELGVVLQNLGHELSRFGLPVIDGQL